MQRQEKIHRQFLPALRLSVVHRRMRDDHIWSLINEVWMSTRVCILRKKSHNQKWGKKTHTHTTRNKKQQTMSNKARKKHETKTGYGRRERQRDSSFAKLRRRDRRDSVRCQELVSTTEPIPVGNPHSKSVGGLFRAKIAISWIDRIRALHFFLNWNFTESTSCCIRI